RIRSARYATHAVSLIGGAMVRRAYRQRSLVEVLLPDGDKLWDPTLRQIDTLLDDDVLVDRVAEALAQRHPKSRRRGRLGTPAAPARPAPDRRAGPRAHAQRGAPGFRDRPTQSHGQPADARRDPRAEPGEDEAALPGPPANHPHGGAPSRARADANAPQEPRR